MSLCVLVTCARASPTIPEALIFVDGSATYLPTLTEPMANILHLFDLSRNDYNNSFLQYEVCITQLRDVNDGCLSVILSLWRAARTAPNGSAASQLVEVIHGETAAVLKDLISIVAGHAKISRRFHSGKESALLTFMSIALDILSREMASCVPIYMERVSVTDNMMQMLDSVLIANDFTQLAPMSRHFAAIDLRWSQNNPSSFLLIDSKGSKSLADISPPSSLLKYFPSTSVHSPVRDFSVHMQNAFDVASAALSWLGVLLGEGDEEKDTPMGNLSASHQLVPCKL